MWDEGTITSHKKRSEIRTPPQVALCDFGLALDLAKTSRSELHEFIGTIETMAPEILYFHHSREVDMSRSDFKKTRTDLADSFEALNK